MSAPALSCDFPLTISVKGQLLSDLLCTAVEGGSNYWASFCDVKRSPEGEYLSVTVVEVEPSQPDNKMVTKNIGLPEMALGLAALCSASASPVPGSSADAIAPVLAGHFTDAISENGDAYTADAVLQMAVFGELVYG